MKEVWRKYKSQIKEGKLDYTEPVDMINLPIHYFAYNKKNDLIKLINKDTLRGLIDIPNTEGDTIAHISAKNKDIELFEYIIEIEPDSVYKLNSLNLSPIFYLVENKKLVKDLVSSINMDDYWICPEYTLLDYYIIEYDIPTLKKLLSEVKHNNHGIFTAINDSDLDNQQKIQVIKLYIESGTNINSSNKTDHITPLIASVINNNIEICKFLIDNGANIENMGPENNYNPLIISIYHGNNDMVKIFCQNEKLVNTPNKFFQIALHYMYFYHKGDIIDYDLKKKILSNTDNLAVYDGGMNSILSLLIKYDDWKQYKKILEKKKMDIYLKNKDGIAPIDLIKSKDKDDFINMVVDSYIYLLRESERKFEDTFDRDMQKKALKDSIMQPEKDAIIKKINESGVSFPQRKVIYEINILDPPAVNLTKFSAYTYNYICYVFYLITKYPELRIPCGSGINYDANSVQGFENLKEIYKLFTKNYRSKSDSDLTSDSDTNNNIRSEADRTIISIIRDHINHHPFLLNHLIIWHSSDKYFISPHLFEGIIDTIKKYPQTKIIMLKLSIISTPDSNHANILLYDIVNRTIERFDPYGIVPYTNNVGLDNFLKKLFKEFMPHVKFWGVDDIFGENRISFQTFSDETNNMNYVENDPIGFCVAWCIWYAEMRALNLLIRPNILVEKTVKKINSFDGKFKDYIRNYSNYIDNQKNTILRTTGVPKKYWYSRNIPNKYYSIYIKNIRHILQEKLE